MCFLLVLYQGPSSCSVSFYPLFYALFRDYSISEAGRTWPTRVMSWFKVNGVSSKLGAKFLLTANVIVFGYVLYLVSVLSITGA